MTIEPVFYGKPFSNAFDKIEATLAVGIDRHRIAMLGDSLHTDILGGAAAGWRTVLVSDYGLMKDIPLNTVMKATGIYPDFVVPSI